VTEYKSKNVEAEWRCCVRLVNSRILAVRPVMPNITKVLY